MPRIQKTDSVSQEQSSYAGPQSQPQPQPQPSENNDLPVFQSGEDFLLLPDELSSVERKVKHPLQSDSQFADEEDDYFKRFPPGWRFTPLDEELVSRYLKPMLYNMEMPPNKIQCANIYEYHPDELAKKYDRCNDRDWYFFSSRDKKYMKGKRPARSAEDGYWKATGADKSIYSTDELVGTKKSLVFYNGRQPNGIKTDWIMHEYCYTNTLAHKKTHEHDMRLDTVLCKIYKKGNCQRENEGEDPIENILVDDSTNNVENIDHRTEN